MLDRKGGFGIGDVLSKYDVGTFFILVTGKVTKASIVEDNVEDAMLWRKQIIEFINLLQCSSSFLGPFPE